MYPVDESMQMVYIDGRFCIDDIILLRNFAYKGDSNPFFFFNHTNSGVYRETWSRDFIRSIKLHNECINSMKSTTWRQFYQNFIYKKNSLTSFFKWIDKTNYENYCLEITYNNTLIM